MYGVDLPMAKPVLKEIDHIPGRMEWAQAEPFGVVIDYAHTPDSLKAVYETLRQEVQDGRLICVLGSAGGGRDTWKRKEFGQLAEDYCDRIFLTNEDPYDERPEDIVEAIAAGITGPGQKKTERIIERGEAIRTALTEADDGDIVVITGKGSETSIAFAGGKKIPWSDRETVEQFLNRG
jgi:UDP-N-acetylmuramoyl-L-alanyl-D-glutamate--2,6-diaminopimelate ligase